MPKRGSPTTPTQYTPRCVLTICEESELEFRKKNGKLFRITSSNIIIEEESNDVSFENKSEVTIEIAKIEVKITLGSEF